MKQMAFLPALILAGLAACITQKPVQQKKENRIALLSVKILKTGEKYEFSVTSHNLVDASFKEAVNHTFHPKENDFAFILLNSGRKPVDTLYVEQPLNPRYEYPLENGEIGSYSMNLNENDVLLKFNYKAGLKWIWPAGIGLNRKFIMFEPVILTFYRK